MSRANIQVGGAIAVEVTFSDGVKLPMEVAAPHELGKGDLGKRIVLYVTSERHQYVGIFQGVEKERPMAMVVQSIDSTDTLALPIHQITECLIEEPQQ